MINMKKLHTRMMMEGKGLWGKLKIEDKVFWPMVAGILIAFLFIMNSILFSHLCKLGDPSKEWDEIAIRR